MPADPRAQAKVPDLSDDDLSKLVRLDREMAVSVFGNFEKIERAMGAWLDALREHGSALIRTAVRESEQRKEHDLALAAAREEGRREMVEEACKAMCSMCRNGWPVTLCLPRDFPAMKSATWCHEKMEDAATAAFPCDAAAIRALTEGAKEG